jgi:hypothetical protein
LQKKALKTEKMGLDHLMKFLVVGYQLEKFKGNEHTWIIKAMCAVLANRPTLQIRKHFYHHLKNYSTVRIDAWVRNVE